VPPAEPFAAFVRVSHMGARKPDAQDFHSEREQEQAIRDAATTEGVDVVMLPPERGVSGGLPLEQRPSLHEAVRGIEAGRYAGLIVAYHSRLGREVEQEEQVWRRVETAGGRIVLALDGVDATSPDGRMVRRIRSAINAREREAHRDAFERRAREATAAGIWQRRQVPLGYRKNAATRRLEPSDTADLVRRAFARRAAGASVTEIADLLGMTTSGARSLLENRVYLGELRVRSYVNPTAHEPLVTRDAFDAAQAASTFPAPRGTRGPSLLAGLVVCAGCGHAMSRTNASYACHGRHSAGHCPAPASVTARRLDDMVAALMVEHLRLLALTRVQDARAVAAARDDEARAEDELHRFLLVVDAAAVSVDDAAAAVRARQDRLDAARATRRRLEAATSTATATDPVALWEHGTPAHRTRLLRGLVEAVLVRRAGGRGARAELAGRVRVIAHGAGLVQRYGGGGAPMPVQPVAFPDADDPAVLRVQVS
jgi:DNA invertase Pin-like site-specific DNA recombinase/cell division septum initiation protein DivIVA